MLTRAVKITFDVRNPGKAKYELELVDSNMLTQAKDFSDDELRGPWIIILSMQKMRF